MRKNDKIYNKDDDSIEEQIKKLKSEEISDRIPILDLIIVLNQNSIIFLRFYIFDL